ALGVWLSRSGPSASKAAPTASPAPAPTATPVASATPAATATPAPDSNLVANGDLETVDGKGHLTGWSVSERNAASVHLLDEDGTRFLRLNNDDPSRSVVADQKLELDPSWKSVKISARLRAKNLKPGAASYQDARVAAAFQNAQETRISNWLAGPSLRTDSATWVQRNVTLDIPSGAKVLYLQLALLSATKQADFNNVTITTMTTPAPPASHTTPTIASPTSTIAGP